MTAAGHFVVEPGGCLTGRVRVPGDKSISHRAVILAALADGITRIRGFLEGADSLATLNAFRAMGLKADGPHDGTLIVHGVGLHGLKPPAQPLDVGNSGTSMRLLAGLLAAQPFDSVLTGDASLQRRPMRRVTEPLTAMGAAVTTSAWGTAPLYVRGGQSLKGIDYVLPVASAQVKSALLLAGLYAEGRTCITEPVPTRDHTERMLAAFGYPPLEAHGRVCVDGGGRLEARDLDVPADISSAAFFLVGASIAPGSDLMLETVGINPRRTGVIDILRAMGADIELHNARELGGEPVADIHVRAAPLKGIRIPVDLVPAAIDEFPAVFVAAACAEGETLLTDAAELRVKESDRIQVMADALTALGVPVEPAADGMRIQGAPLDGGTVTSHGDHRVAMALSMAALRARRPVVVQDCTPVETSFPNYPGEAAGAGLRIRAVDGCEGTGS